MTGHPHVSVVMSVYHGAESLGDTVKSVLSQEGLEFEFIIVDDGSVDSSPSMLEQFAASDSRVRVVRQENSGLTRALIRGCAMARGTYIARQDCGDLSLPGRLRDELRAIELHGGGALVSCGTRFIGPREEPLYDVVPTDEDATAGLLTLDPKRQSGPSHHGSTMFRRDLYERVGGYREQFYFAQDLDLWTRLAEHGPHIALPSILYQARFTLDSISGLQRKRQIECARIIIECVRLRRAGLSDAPQLERAASIRPEHRKAGASDLASAMYFVGACLQARGDPRAKSYFRDALRSYPLHVKSAIRLLLG